MAVDYAVWVLLLSVQPAVTTGGFNAEDCTALAHWICDILDGIENGNLDDAIAAAKVKVAEICKRLPVYG